MLSLAKFVKKEVQLRENLVGAGFLGPPSRKKRDRSGTRGLGQSQMQKKNVKPPVRVTVLGEIVSALDFDAENIYIRYQLFLPPGWAFEDANEFEIAGVLRDDQAEFNKRSSTTQMSKARVELIDDEDQIEGTQYVSHFCFPLDFQFLAEDENMDDRPYLLLEVRSLDSWGRDRCEGYGYCRLPHEPGYHAALEVECWRPRSSLSHEIHSFFLGGSIPIRRLEEIVRTSYLDKDGKDDIVNRFGLETENSGKVRLNLNMCYQSKEARKKNRHIVSLQKEEELLEMKKQIVRYRLEIKERLDLKKKKALLERRKGDHLEASRLEQSRHSTGREGGRRRHASLEHRTRFEESLDYNLSQDQDTYFQQEGIGGPNWQDEQARRDQNLDRNQYDERDQYNMINTVGY